MLFPSKRPRFVPPEATPPPRGHIAALDGIRGLAILTVTIYRIAGGGQGHDSTPQEWLWEIISHGDRGVDLFFVLSGFLITGILYDSKADPHFFRNFYARRSLRIFPLYYAVLLVALVLAPLFSVSAKAAFAPAISHQPWLWLYGTNLLQSAAADWPFGCFNHFWSLAVEEHFYFLWPLVIFSLSRRSSIAACIAVIALSSVSRIAFVMFGGNTVAPEVFTLFRADALALGALAALLARGPKGLVPYSLPARVGLSALTVAAVAVSLSHRQFLTIPSTLFAALFACLLVTILTVEPTSMMARFWTTRTLRFFGKYSYSMYVFQYPLIVLLAPVLSIELIARIIHDPTAARIAYIALMTAITCACSLVSWHLLERRCLALKHHFEAKVAERPAAQ